MVLFFFINIFILIFLSILFGTASIMAVGLLGLFMLFFVTKNLSYSFLKSLNIIFSISIFTTLIFYFAYLNQYGLPYFDGGSDDLDFEEYSKYIVEKEYYMPNELTDDSILQHHNSKGFLWILSWIMRYSELFGGYHTIAFRVLNIYFLLILSVLTLKIFQRHNKFTQKQNLIFLYLFALFPNIQYISLHVFRDTLSILLIFSTFYLWEKFFSSTISGKKLFLVNILLTSIFCYIAYWIRHENIIFIGALVLISTLKEKTLSYKNFGLFLALALVGVILMDNFNIWETVVSFNERYSNHKLEISDGLSNIIFSMPLFPLGLAIRMIYALISPIPIPVLNIFWMFNDIKIFSNVIISIGVIIQIYMLPYLFKNIKKIDKFTLSFCIMLIAIAVTTFTFRHFIMLYPFMYILIFRQFFISEKSARISYFVSMTIVLGIGASVYIMIR